LGDPATGSPFFVDKIVDKYSEKMLDERPENVLPLQNKVLSRG
jgi:hypothetical protein